MEGDVAQEAAGLMTQGLTLAAPAAALIDHRDPTLKLYGGLPGNCEQVIYTLFPHEQKEKCSLSFIRLLQSPKGGWLFTLCLLGLPSAVTPDRPSPLVTPTPMKDWPLRPPPCPAPSGCFFSTHVSILL